jgi:ethanolamine ammonia-lyase small subunit
MTNEIDKRPSPVPVSDNDRTHDFSPYSHARLGLGHVGGHLKVAHWLDFQAGFAQAKDAVFSRFDPVQIAHLCDALQLTHLTAHSEVTDVMQFLTRPDLGRMLSCEDQNKLREAVHLHQEYCHQNLLIVISGGLSPLAIQQQIPEFLPRLSAEIHAAGWSLAPIIINPRGRVALGDQLNTIFKAKVVIMLIGERPGLTTPDSLGIYLTYNARPRCTDDMRNCISNIHKHGLSTEEAVDKLRYLITISMQKKISGISLGLLSL